MKPAQIISAITSHFGETLVRLRFTEYVGRFVRLASRYEEMTSGVTKINYPSIPFAEGSLGGGVVFPDEASALKELAANASRIEAWRKTRSYQHCIAVSIVSFGTRANHLIGDRISKNCKQPIRSSSISHISYPVFVLSKISRTPRLS